jgi:hypothetical protein
MKIAVCFSGQVRTFAENAPGLHAMFTAAAGGDANVHYYGALHAEDRDWATRWPWHAVTLEQMEAVPRYHHPALGHPRNKEHPEFCLWQQWQGIMSVGQLLRLHEWLRGARYDWVVRCRFDLAVRAPMERLATLAPTAAYFPRCDNWYGLNDRFAFGPSVLMEHYWTFPYDVGRYLVEPVTHKVAGEGFIAQHLQARGVPIARTTAVLVTNRGNGKIDEPVYHTAHGDIPPA